MTSNDEINDKIEELAEVLRRQPKGAAQALLHKLQTRLGHTPPTLEQSAGLTLSTTSHERLELSDTKGKALQLHAGQPLIFLPTVIESAAGSTPALVSSLLFVTVRNAGKASAVLGVDAAGLYRNAARWGVVRVLLRRHEHDSAATLSALDGMTAQMDVPAGAALEILVVAHAPRLDAARVFGSPPGAASSESR